MSERLAQAPTTEARPLLRALLHHMETERGWMDRARCRDGVDPAIFDAEAGSNVKGDGGTRTERVAMRVCATCPVRLDCLAYCLDVEARPIGASGGLPLRFGIWGGTTPRDRNRVGHLSQQDQLAVLNDRFQQRVVRLGIVSSLEEVA